ncbi:MAG: response regulator [Deltaproteobacteria bacterium]|nr:response regulator [Deltaproteobacteria bacterium]
MDQPMKILVVDDSRMIRRTIRKELEGGGYEVIEAQNGLEGLTKLAEPSPPDLVTLDIEMPKLNGFDTCQKLRGDRYARFFSHCPDNRMPVIFITGNDTMEDRKRGFALGAADFISKPFPEGAILSAVDKVLKPAQLVQGMTALVVDDSGVARHIVTEYLRREGLRVIQAKDGREALDILRRQAGEIDMVITDLNMPRMDGCQLARSIRGELNQSDLPVIFLTASADESGLLEVFKAGATDHLVKPFAKEELLARIRVHLERNRLNKNLRNMVHELTDLNRMKDNLLAVCSHDLRSPLNGILGFTDMLLEKNYLESEDREGLTHIKNSGNVLLGLINDILDLSKAKAEQTELKMDPIVLHQVIQTSLNSLGQMAAGKSQTIRLRDQVEGAVIMGNASGLGRVFNNLLSNAIKFTPDNGTIHLHIEPGPPGKVRVKVADTGIGIPEDKIPYLFDQFTSTSQSGTGGEVGTGLGMSIVKEILEKHEVPINVESETGKGTCFTLTFPTIDKAPIDNGVSTKKSTGASPETSSEKKQLSILLAEDNLVNQKLAEKMLTKSGHKVTVAGTGKEAFLKYSESPEKVDLIFMDVQMPEMDGLESTRAIRKFEKEKNMPKVPIVAMTGQAMEGDRERCLETGMDDYIIKPINKTVLLEMIQKF